MEKKILIFAFNSVNFCNVQKKNLNRIYKIIAGLCNGPISFSSSGRKSLLLVLSLKYDMKETLPSPASCLLLCSLQREYTNIYLKAIFVT